MAKYKDFNDYINQSQPFAQPILQYLRKLIHDTHPELEEELFQWLPLRNMLLLDFG